MSFVTSTSLAASDSMKGLKRHSSSGLLKHTSERMSKQHIMAMKMFGSKKGMHGKDLKIGKKFRKSGKGIMHGATSGDNGSIGPSVEEFDDMMKSSVTHNPNKKKSLFSRKQFG